MAQIFSPAAETWFRAVIVVAGMGLAAIILFGFGIVRSDYFTGQSAVVNQPVPFSHLHHVGQLGLDCRYCHTSVETAANAGFPATHVCMTCHSQIWTGAAMLAPVRQSLASATPLHWRRVNALPDYVYFDHSIHVAKGVGCATCHGAVDEMPLMRKVAPFTMGWCLDCHRDPAPRLRPRDAVFDLHWQGPRDRRALGEQLIQAYHIDLGHLTDCTVCHR